MPKHIRQIRIEGNVAFIPLTQGYEAIIDATDVPLVYGCNWTAAVRDHTVYAYRSMPRPSRDVVLLHRLISGATKGLLVDHIDSNGLNNRRDNLRLATYSQNCCNQRLARHNTSGFKGVTWNKGCEKWLAQIRVNGRGKHLGLFRCPTSAHLAYCKASKELHGEFGRSQ